MADSGNPTALSSSAQLPFDVLDVVDVLEVVGVEVVVGVPWSSARRCRM
jgi:hypothetical protein